MLPWLKLIRLPNLPTAIANVMAAFLLVHQSWAAWPQWLLLVLASTAFYSAGMILNDVFDLQRDAVERPQRPLPSGEVKVGSAKKIAWTLLTAGIIAAIVAGALAGSLADVLKCAVLGGLLAVSIYLYDGPLKQTPLAPWLMGACRSFNIMLGGATASSVQVGYCVAGFPVILWGIAFSIGLLITGVTFLARNEAQAQQSRTWIGWGSMLIVAGLISLAMTPAIDFGNLAISQTVSQVYPFMIAMISVTIVRRLVICIVQANAKSVKHAVIGTLRSLIVFDAAVCFLARPHDLGYAIVVLALLIPVLVLSRWLYAT
jgi:4-hydroxybenzoate polyprenyltransferase